MKPWNHQHWISIWWHHRAPELTEVTPGEWSSNIIFFSHTLIPKNHASIISNHLKILHNHSWLWISITLQVQSSRNFSADSTPPYRHPAPGIWISSFEHGCPDMVCPIIFKQRTWGLKPFDSLKYHSFLDNRTWKLCQHWLRGKSAGTPPKTSAKTVVPCKISLKPMPWRWDSLILCSGSFTTVEDRGQKVDLKDLLDTQSCKNGKMQGIPDIDQSPVVPGSPRGLPPPGLLEDDREPRGAPSVLYRLLRGADPNSNHHWVVRLEIQSRPDWTGETGVNDTGDVEFFRDFGRVGQDGKKMGMSWSFNWFDQ